MLNLHVDTFLSRTCTECPPLFHICGMYQQNPWTFVQVRFVVIYQSLKDVLVPPEGLD